MISQNVPDIATKIGVLINALKEQGTVTDIVKQTNDILIFGDKIPISLLKSSWDYFARRKGVTDDE